MADSADNSFMHWSQGLSSFDMFLSVVGMEVEAMARGVHGARIRHGQFAHESALVHYRVLVEFFTGPTDSTGKRRDTDMSPCELVSCWPSRGLPAESVHLARPVDLGLVRQGTRTLSKWFMHLTSERLDQTRQVIGFGLAQPACQVVAISADFELAIRQGSDQHPDPLILRSHNHKAFKLLHEVVPRVVELTFAEQPSGLGLI